MSSDGGRRRRPRPIDPPCLPAGPLKDLKDAVYDLYLGAETPTLDEMQAEVDALGDSLSALLRRGGLDDDGVEKQLDQLEGALPRRDTIGRIIGSTALPPSQADLVVLVVALARMAGRLPAHTSRRDVPALVARTRQLWRRARAAPPPRRLGRPIRECTPLALEVHRAIETPDRDTDLPRYVPRAHDERLRELVTACADGASRMVTLVGGSSTGKTRACWEAVRSLPAEWRLWHPIDPSRPAAAARDIAEAGPHTVVWLNEAQSYLLSADPALNERISAGLRGLLNEPERGPVLVLATMWPEHWTALTSRPPPDAPDRHAQARELLAGTDLRVPDNFRGADLRAARGVARSDGRLRRAVAQADNGRLTQYLAGVPELVQRCRNAPAPARAVIEAAVDARRFGHPPSLSSELLQTAATGYLHDVDLRQAGPQWAERAFGYALEPCLGVAGILSVVRAGPDRLFGLFERPDYRLADYLEEAGREDRAEAFPPETFWDAIAASVRDRDVLRTIGEQAERRGRNGRAAQLYQRSASFGDVGALVALGRLHHQAGDLAGAESLYTMAAGRGSFEAWENRASLWELRGRSVDDAVIQQRLMEMAEKSERFDELYADWIGEDEVSSILRRARRLRDTGELTQAQGLYEEAARAGDTSAMAELATIHEQVGDHVQATTQALLAARAGKADAAVAVVRSRETTGRPESAESVAVQAAELGQPAALYLLAGMRPLEKLESIIRHAVRLGFPHVYSVAAERQHPVDPQLSRQLYEKAAHFGDIAALTALALVHEDAKQPMVAEELVGRAADQGDTQALVTLADRREQSGDFDGAETLYRRAAAEGSVAGMRGLAHVHEDRGDHERAEELLLAVINRGHDVALSDLAALHEHMGDHVGADRMRCFGLDDEGRPQDPGCFGTW
ncbi:SEL1-like repeat protein [Actinoplanes sp. CA-054009]